MKIENQENILDTEEKSKLKIVRDLEIKRWKSIEEMDSINSQIKKMLYEIIKKNQKNTAALINLGAIYCDEGKFETALEYLNIAKDLKSKDKNLFLNLGYVSINLQKEEKVWKAYFKSAEGKIADPLTFEAYFDPHAY